ncbi:hypothetical protein RJ639_041529 [Escallonia herrerae]|uniref:RRM domain-containing protein n=1 Tax=Escallonia herrerae TaxID=1293975 RepID=A0AA88WFE1_9ASTE|nr:hypothetical protein RJ639_041529 [Escallonia herrerae]
MWLVSAEIRTIKVSNVSLGASLQDIKEFFSFSGDIEYVEMRSYNERSQIAFVTFKDPQGAETAVLLSVTSLLFISCVVLTFLFALSVYIASLQHLLSDVNGATIVDLTVSITLDPEYQLPPAASAPPFQTVNITPGGADSALRKAEDVVSSMLAKGFVLGKDAVNKAKTLDEKHQLTSTATAKVASFDKKIGLTEKISVGSSIVNEKVREVDQKLQVSEKAKSAFAVAEQTVSSAGSAVMKNRYVLTGASWVTGAFNKVAKAAGEVGQHTKEKVGMAEEEKRRKMVDDFAQVHLSESPEASEASHPAKPAPVQGWVSLLNGLLFLGVEEFHIPEYDWFLLPLFWFWRVSNFVGFDSLLSRP